MAKLQGVFSTAGANILSKVMTLALSILLARSLGVGDFGKYQYYLSILTLLSFPVTAGIPQLVVRYLSVYYNRTKYRLAHSFLRWVSNFILITSLFLCAVALSVITNEKELNNKLLIFVCIAISIISKGLISKNSGELNVIGSPAMSVLQSTVFNVALVILFVAPLYIINGNVSFDMIVLITMMSYLLSLVFGWSVIKKRSYKALSYSYSVKRKIKKDWYNTLFSLSLVSILSLIPVEVAIIYLGRLGLSDDIAFIKVAIQLSVIFVFIQNVINTVIGPKLSILFKSNDNLKIQYLLRKNVRANFFLVLPLAIFIYLFGENLISIAYGREYSEAMLYFVILSVGQIINVLSGPVLLVMNMSGNNNAAVKIMVTSSLITIFLIFFLTDLYGSKGTVIALAFGNSIWNIVMSFDIYRLLKLKVWIH
ncbi:membrane hypothetical protein [Vibrio chagasii]|nr:membrane hypothetical protein [Vibrio chagasii]